MNNTGFADIREYGKNISNDKATRYFTADAGPTGLGLPFLPCPGLKSVREVRVGGMLLPFSERREFPLDNNSTHPSRAGLRSKEVDVPLIRADIADDGTPVLIRHECSNDGIWQPGIVVAITGEWSDEEPAPAPETPSGKGKK